MYFLIHFYHDQCLSLQVSLSAFALLFSEMVQYAQSRSNTVTDLQTKLHELGYQVEK